MNVSKKVESLNEQRKKKKPRTLEEAAKAAVRRYCDPNLLNSSDEPEGLASGKTNKSGGFTPDDETEETENKEKDNDKKK